ncbi:MAG: HD domain-containing protein [Oscillospiraceae bacterium]|nr:HD domain-containing protein [Oscillospiraceae bacterium]
MDIEKIKAIAAGLLMDKKSHPWKERGNKYHHGERVGKMSVAIRKLMLPDDDSHDDIMLAAALFHDMANGDVKRAEHGKVGAERTRELIKDLCTEAELNDICHIIEVHDDRYPNDDRYPYWVKLHQDAGYLDHFGCYDVWMSSIECAANGKTVMEGAEFMVEERGKWMMAIHGELNYEISHEILNEKLTYQREFGERFVREMNGEIIGLDDMWKKLNGIK